MVEEPQELTLLGDIQTIIDRNYWPWHKKPNKAEEAHEYNSSELMEMLHTSFEKKIPIRKL
jgi:type I restriction enzyme M protein